MHVHKGVVVGVYNVQKERELPKLHRAVWKGNFEKVMKLTKGMKMSELNSTDKEKRYTRDCAASVSKYSVSQLHLCMMSMVLLLPCRTALHFACAGRREAIVSHLCTVAKADPNMRDSSGCTPLHRVREKGDIDVHAPSSHLPPIWFPPVCTG